MIDNFTIYGERCSGTNFLENSIKENFELELTWKYGFKHFFGHDSLKNSDNTLFIGIVRNPFDWINSFYEEKHNLPEEISNNINSFLFKYIYLDIFKSKNDIINTIIYFNINISFYHIII